MRVNIRVRNTLKTILLITVVVLFVLSLSSCGHSKIEGVIIEKYYEPPSTYITAIPIIVNGKTVITTMPQYRGAQYKIKVCSTNDDGTDAIIIVSVSPEEYDKIEIGDYYTNYRERKEEKR